MGSITKRKNKNGAVRFRAVIRINREGYPSFTQSRTFSKKALADAWIKKREAEIEANPDILLKRTAKSIRLSEAINRYIDEQGDQFSISHIRGLKLIGRLPIGAKQLKDLRREDYTTFADARLSGKYEGLKPIKPQTVNGDMIGIRAILKQAKLAWGLDVSLSEFEDAMLGLKHSRKVSSSDKRTRTLTWDELQLLTNHFYAKYNKRKTAYPMHLIIWFAIYTARRQSEIVRLRLDDYIDGWWLVRDAKNPRGSRGNHINTRITDKAAKVIDMIIAEDVRANMVYPNKLWDKELLLPLSAHNISKIFTETCVLLGIKDLHFHDLRHEAATRLAGQGMTVPEMQKITGHESWSSLQRYVNLTPRKTVLEFDEAMAEAKRAWHDGH